MSFITPAPTSTLHKKAYASISPSRPILSTKGESIVITGAGSGVGARTALAFAESGASHLALLGRTEKTLASTKAVVEDAYPDTHVHIYTADITDVVAIKAALGSFARVVGSKIDVLVANAGYLAKIEPVTASTPEEWWYGFEANVKGQYHLVREFLQVAAADATLINVSSCVAHLPYVPGHSSYHLSKLAAIKLFDYVQAENPGLTVMNFHPGVIETGMSQKSFDAGIPKVETDDVDLPASFAVWCASPEARPFKGRYLWASWDVEELKSKAGELEGSDRLTIGLIDLGGW